MNHTNTERSIKPAPQRCFDMPHFEKEVAEKAKMYAGISASKFGQEWTVAD